MHDPVFPDTLYVNTNAATGGIAIGQVAAHLSQEDALNQGQIGHAQLVGVYVLQNVKSLSITITENS
jgi:hypothetical protein